MAGAAPSLARGPRDDGGPDDVLAYFKRRLAQAPRDATFALE